VSRLRNHSRRQHIEKIATEAGLAKQCLFHWEPYSYSELLAYLAVTSVVVVPYNCATQSGVVALAAGFGIPVVATSVGGLPEMVKAGKTGEIVPPKNSRALAHAIAHVVVPNTLYKYRQNARKYADSYLSPKNSAKIVRQCLEAAEV
jgi:glycosyltransferase involved in cell wall biosynthesis